MAVRLAVLCAFLLINSLLFYKAVWGTGGLLDHRDLVRQQQAAEEECRRLDAENRALSRDIRLLQTDPRFVEKMVRDRLHYLRGNEILYLFDGSPKTQSSGGEAHERKDQLVP